MTTAATETTEAMPMSTTPETMQSIVQERYGTDPGAVLRVGEATLPAVGDDEVLVHVRAASIDQGTWHLMAGLPYLARTMGFGMRAPKAANPGRCLAGTVERVGGDVTDFEPGDQVYGTAPGSFAEYAVAPAAQLARMPANLSFEQAASVPISAVTALQALRDHAHVHAGQHVLIVGASGGVGTYAVQIAKAFGAEVTGVCRGAKADVVRALGADHVVDYEREDFADGTHRYDVILDIGGNRRLSQLRRALTPSGTLVIVGGETDGKWLGGVDRTLRAPLVSVFVRQKLTMLVSSENRADLDAVTRLIESGQVVPVVDRTYPLRDVPEAIRDLREGRVRGKLVVAVPG